MNKFLTDIFLPLLAIFVLLVAVTVLSFISAIFINMLLGV